MIMRTHYQKKKKGDKMTFDEQEDVFSEEEKPKKGRKIPIELTDEPTPKPVKRGRPRKIKVAEIEEVQEPVPEPKATEEKDEKEPEKEPEKTWVYPNEGGFIAAPNSATFPWEKCADFEQLSNLINIVWPSANIQSAQLKTKALAPFIHNFFNRDGKNEPSFLGDAIAAALLLKMADKIGDIPQEEMSESIKKARGR